MKAPWMPSFVGMKIFLISIFCFFRSPPWSEGSQPDLGVLCHYFQYVLWSWLPLEDPSVRDLSDLEVTPLLAAIPIHRMWLTDQNCWGFSITSWLFGLEGSVQFFNYSRITATLLSRGIAHGQLAQSEAPTAKGSPQIGLVLKST
jgi:hypothetical protein